MAQPDPLLPIRTTLVLLLATLTGIGAGVLTWLSGQPWPTAVLAGCGTTASALVLFHTLIDDN